MRVIAEGVENGEVLEDVQAIDCDEAQGYGIARLMDQEHFARWLAQHSSKGS